MDTRNYSITPPAESKVERFRRETVDLTPFEKALVESYIRILKEARP